MKNMIVSYLTLRKVIGILGIILGPVCIIGGLILIGKVETSISAYYYTGMSDIFVGVLVTAGAFLLTYNGYDLKDTIVSSISGASAIGVALFPMSGPWGIHYVMAGIFFISLAYMAFFQFTQGKDVFKNRIYKICGIVIIICILISLVSSSIPYSVLVLEIIMLAAFGISWLLKGISVKEQRI